MIEGEDKVAPESTEDTTQEAKPAAPKKTASRKSSAKAAAAPAKETVPDGMKPGHPEGYVATRQNMFDPYEKLWYRTNGEATKPKYESSWLECQVNAGVIKRVGE